MSTLTMRISVTLCIILILTHHTTSLPRPQQRNDAAVAEAIDYLHQLDAAYSHSSRPRFGKRSHGKFYNIPANNNNNNNDDEEDWPEYPFVRR